ncbi:MIP/aquaporin family protein [Membranihabitans marinus]|uniref:MIP/aquaporin family protein n=1 Tax=Membranihabitans marinus TaxID=1227546 RepID=UPI001F43494A|nr:MIP/aquaporin family protein [Membranihabitans marinus]
MTPYIAELIGTFLLILLGNGVVANVALKDTYAGDGGWIVITTGWALAVFTGVVVAGPYSGAHLNPAVTLGLAITGQFLWVDVLPYIMSQMLGAMLGAFFVYLFYRSHYRITEDEGAIKATFCTSPAIDHRWNNLLSEVLGTFVLIFVVLYISGAQLGEVDPTPIGLGSIGAIPVAFLVWVIGLSLGGTTGYAINPARDMGPRIVYSFLYKNPGWNYAWIPVVGPVIGAFIAGGLYLLLM